MNSEWWDIFFNDIYSRFRRILTNLVHVSVISRIIICITISYQHSLKSPQLEGLLIIIALV